MLGRGRRPLGAFGPWLIAIIAVLAVFVDIPKHQISFPFNCPGICLKVGDFQVNQEIKTHLGLDLQGGTQLILRMQTEKLPAGNTQTPSQLQQLAMKVIERRINSLGVSEPVLQGVGDDKILLELPGVDDLAQANDIATRQAFLEIKVPDADHPGQYKSLQPPLTGANLKPTFVTFQNGTKPVINFEFTNGDDQRWVQLSKDFYQKPVQITLDGKEISAPTINAIFTDGRGIIEGGFTAKSSLVAGAIGLFLVAFFMVAYYRLPGVIAVIALLYYTALTYALFRLVPVTLTLAGVAGFILSIGMAVDANVLTFERLKEELRAGKSLRNAVEAGRVRAFPSILYSNLATIMTAGILFWFGTGTVKGFALTLAIGVAMSFFTAVVVTQMLLHGAIEIASLRQRRLYGVEERAVDTGAPRSTAAVSP
ncbi:MAG: preprotein translocase subunit SecD [Chloroflexi bacterium]|nr:MAG: preprotein translocase subunit SecD [Chloroflexota bacterium]